MTVFTAISKASLSLSGLLLLSLGSQASAFGDVSLPTLVFPTKTVAETAPATACETPTCPERSDVTRSVTSLTAVPVTDGQ